MDGRTKGWTDNPNTRCPRRTIQARGFKRLKKLLCRKHFFHRETHRWTEPFRNQYIPHNFVRGGIISFQSGHKQSVICRVICSTRQFDVVIRVYMYHTYCNILLLSFVYDHHMYRYVITWKYVRHLVPILGLCFNVLTQHQKLVNRKHSLANVVLILTSKYDVFSQLCQSYAKGSFCMTRLIFG